ncbi:uncharacterized protein LOC143366476 isoform X3 [Andrena cerasifolii]|uniref:uncharacterized protein LOC143366476 isoform X3 n=1 Tax=Andrena cerasifolii TaxID=2819439 RepID=UPI00403792ED
MLCKVESTRGNGVAEAIGNWGFSNKVSSPGRELQRLKYLSEKMACMKTSKPMMCVKYNCKNDPEACIGTDLLHIIPGRSYVLQGTDKWYRRGAECHPQPSCLAPQCPRPYCC